MSRASFVVTTKVEGKAQALLWDGISPLPIGRPYRYVLQRSEDHIYLRDLAGDEKKPKPLKTGENFSIEGYEGKSVVVRIAPAHRPEALTKEALARAKAPSFTPREAQANDPELKAFKRALQYAAAAVVGLLVIAWIWPKPDAGKEELVPPQFAKIVLTPNKAVAHEEKAASAGASANVKKAQDAAVVQAFRAKALQNAVSGLLKGGMTTLLAQSNFVAGTNASANAKRIFDSKSSSLVSTARAVGPMDAKEVQVAGVGGGGIGGKGGAGVGYGKGERAGVKGQGGSFVSMDTAGSAVEEGLTKDEVGEVIHKHLSEVRYCYESAMLRTPDLEGKLMVSFTIGGNGMVKTAAPKESSLPDPRLDDCIIRRLMTWKFPNPKGGIDVAVTYPFIFKTLGR